MAWKNLSYWLRGLVIVDVIIILFLIASYPAISVSEYKDYVFLGGLVAIVFWGLIGALIGFIVGKIKNRGKL